MKHLIVFLLLACPAAAQIIYPVDPINDRFSVMKDGVVIKRGQVWPKADGTAIEDLAEDVDILQEVIAPQPVAGVDYDPATHRLGDRTWTDDVPTETATLAWTIVPLTQEELDAIAGAEDRQTKAVDLQNAIATLRSWSDDYETWSIQATDAAAAVTSGNAVQTLQNLLTRMATAFQREAIFKDRFADLLEVQRIGE